MRLYFGDPSLWRTTSTASSMPSSRKPLITVAMSASLARIRDASCVSWTIHSTAPMSAPLSTRNSNANNTAWRKISDLMILIGRKQSVPHAADGLNGVDREACVEAPAQSADMAFHHVGVRVEIDVPHLLQQHLAGHDAIRVSEQILHEPKFLRKQLDAPAIAGDRAFDQVHLDRPCRQPGDGARS